MWLPNYRTVCMQSIPCEGACATTDFTRTTGHTDTSLAQRHTVRTHPSPPIIEPQRRREQALPPATTRRSPQNGRRATTVPSSAKPKHRAQGLVGAPRAEFGKPMLRFGKATTVSHCMYDTPPDRSTPTTKRNSYQCPAHCACRHEGMYVGHSTADGMSAAWRTT